jgi:hypothetical protein
MTEQNHYERTTTSGNWALKDGEIVWEETTTTTKFDAVLREWVKTTSETIDKTPQESPFELQKSMNIDIVLLREKETDDSPTGKIVLTYLRKLHVAVRPEFENVWLTLGDDKRVYAKDLMRMVTYRIDPSSGDELLIIKKISEKRITQDEAKQLETGYVFSKFEDVGNGEVLYGTFISPQRR